MMQDVSDDDAANALAGGHPKSRRTPVHDAQFPQSGNSSGSAPGSSGPGEPYPAPGANGPPVTGNAEIGSGGPLGST
jgi:hypothetical protein